MGEDEPIELDPDVLADPLAEEGESGRKSPPAANTTQDGRSTSLVPAGERSLAPYDPFRRYRAEIAKYLDDTYTKEKKSSLKSLRSQSYYAIELGAEIEDEAEDDDDADVYDDRHFEDCAACGADTLIVELDRNEKKSGARYCDPCTEDESVR